MLQAFAKDLVKYLPSRVLPGVFGVLLVPIITRLFTTEEYGLYTLVITTVSVLTILSTEWIGPSVIRFYPRYEMQSALGTFGATIFRLAFVSIVLTGTATLSSLWLFRERLGTPKYYLVIGAFVFILSASFNIILQLLTARRLATQYSFYSVWQQCGCILIGLFFASTLSLGVPGLLLGAGCGLLIVLPSAFHGAFRGLQGGNYCFKAGKEMMQYGFPLMATNLASWVLHLSDRYVISAYRGSHEVGLYAISYSIADRSVSLIISLVALASGPIAMTMWEREGAEATREFVEKLAKYFLIVATPAAVGLCLVGEPLLRLLASPKYREGHKIMPLIVMSMFLLGLQRNFQLGLLFHKKTRIIMVILVASGTLNVAMNLWLVPRWGFVGAGWAAFAGYGALSGLMIIASRRYFVWEFPFKTLGKVLVALSVMSLAVTVLLKWLSTHIGISVLLSVICGSGVYFALLVLMKEINLKAVKENLTRKSRSC